MTQSKKIAILGASGYTGAELVRLISSHPFMDIVALCTVGIKLFILAITPFTHLDGTLFNRL